MISNHRKLGEAGGRRVGHATAVTDASDDVSLLVAFTDDDGALHTVTSQGANTSWSSKHGQALAVLDDPGQPEKARIEADLVFLKRLSLFLGFVFGAVALALLVIAWL